MKLTRIPEETGRETSGDSSDSMPPKGHAPRQFDGTEHEWKYTGRNESEEAEPQPISAPTGLEAQKIKGFQRFYQAVVSPTHVRVTAGGRIVPNNRSSSPTTKYSKEKTTTNDPYIACQHPAPEQAGFQFPPNSYGPFSMYPGFPSGVGHVGMPPPPPYMMPWPMPIGMGMGMGMGGNFAMPVPNGAQVPQQQHPSFAPKDPSRGDKRSESGVSENANPTPATHVEHMDPSRGGFYGGPIMMPPCLPPGVPPGSQFIPYPMPPPPGFPGAPYGMPMMAPPPMGFDPHTHPPTSKANMATENEAATSNTRSPRGFAPTSNPPVSSIRPSDITKRHIDILRSRLRYLEDQLSYNKHQIDEKAVNYDAQTVRQYISQFEKTLESQLSSKGGRRSKSAQQQGSGSATPSKAVTIRKSAVSSETKSLRERSSYSENASIGYSVGKKLSQIQPGAKIPSTLDSTYPTEDYTDHERPVTSPTDHVNGNNRSSLTRAAAMAAPFQPRHESSGEVDKSSQARRSGTSSMEVQSSGDLGYVESRTGGRRQPPWPSSQSSARDTLGVPYLVGQLPHGSRAGYHRDASYVYDRPLTEDELRARHMYWGKAPRELQKGLPKFNGKDFFPPSPVKSRSAENSSSSEAGTRTRARHAVSIVKPDNDPFHSLGQTGPILTRNGPGHSTQSEALPRLEQGSTDEQLTVASSRTVPQSTRIGRSLDDVNRGFEETAPTSSEGARDKSSSDETDDDREIIFTGRRSMGRGSVYVPNPARSKPMTNSLPRKKDGMWSSMLKKAPASANAVPSTLTSTTAQGVLPHYSGHATASLTPTITNKAASARKTFKVGDIRDSKLTGSVSRKSGEENRPPRETFEDIA